MNIYQRSRRGKSMVAQVKVNAGFQKVDEKARSQISSQALFVSSSSATTKDAIHRHYLPNSMYRQPVCLQCFKEPNVLFLCRLNLIFLTKRSFCEIPFLYGVGCVTSITNGREPFTSDVSCMNVHCERSRDHTNFGSNIWIYDAKNCRVSVM